MKIKAALVLGPDEVEKGLVVVKNLGTGDQEQVRKEAVFSSLQKILW